MLATALEAWCVDHHDVNVVLSALLFSEWPFVGGIVVKMKSAGVLILKCCRQRSGTFGGKGLRPNYFEFPLLHVPVQLSFA